jgi:hypothetical protein
MNDFIGMREEEAIKICKKKNISYRIIAKNGENFIVTMDFQMMRINFTIQDGIVTSQQHG